MGTASGMMANRYQHQLPTPLADGRYTLQTLLDQDAIRARFLATDHEAFGRTVIIEALLSYFDPAHPQADAATRARFLHDVKTIAGLKHPAIAQIFAYFREGPHAYIVLEHIEGDPLAQSLSHTAADGSPIDGQPYPLRDVIGWGIALCRVLEYLASRQMPVVHATICPAHILRDRHSGELRLIGFGGSAAGVVGYAAPEQAQGQTSPASDIYALAATLYHLATDDDPAAHPGEFPLLGQLGRFGATLRHAVDPDSTQRPTPVALRQHLETVLATLAVRSIEAPDGRAIADVPALVHWCQHHWAPAADWLYGKLPDQIELRWQQSDLADQLRNVVQHQRNHDLGLDAVLAMLDPQGYGASQSDIAVSDNSINYGKVAYQSRALRTLQLTNRSQRCAQVQLQHPAWFSIAQKSLILPPGSVTEVTLALRPYETRVGAKHNDQLLIDTGTVVHTVATRVYIVPSKTFWHSLGRHKCLMTLIVLLMPCVLLWGGLEVLQVVRKADLYSNGVAAFERENWGAAKQSFNQLYRMQSNYRDIDTLRWEPYYGAGEAALAQDRWPSAQQEFAAIEPYLTDPDVAVRIGAIYNDKLHDAIAAQEWESAAEALVHAHLINPAYADVATEHPELSDVLEQMRTTAWQQGNIQLGWVTIKEKWSEDPLFSTSEHLIAFGEANRVAVRQRGTPQPLYTTTFEQPVQDMTFSPAENFLVISTGSAAYLWDLASETVHPIVIDKTIRSFGFSPDEQLIAFGLADGRVTVWPTNALNQAPLYTLAGHSSGVLGVTFSPDGQLLATSSQDGTVALWQARDGTQRQILLGHSDAVSDVSFSLDGQLLASGGHDGKLLLRRVGDDTIMQTFSTQGDAMQQVAFAPDGQVLAAGTSNGKIYFWNLSDGTHIQTLEGTTRSMDDLAFLDDGLILVAASNAEMTEFWYARPYPGQE